MAKQFLANRSGQTPTLDEVPNETIKIYPTEAALDNDLANLEENEIVATDEDNNPASGTQYPVDVVQDGNMHAVTSNAVYDYSNPTTTIIESTVKRTVTLDAYVPNWYGAELKLPPIPENKRLIRYIPYVSLNYHVAVSSAYYRTGKGIITPCIICVSDANTTCDIWWAAEVADK